mgnify:CR=1 FL=1
MGLLYHIFNDHTTGNDIYFLLKILAQNLSRSNVFLLFFSFHFIKFVLIKKFSFFFSLLNQRHDGVGLPAAFLLNPVLLRWLGRRRCV